MQKHKVYAFIGSLIAAVALWVYAVTVVNPDDKAMIRGVRVRIVGISDLEADGLMLTGGEEQYVDVEVAGRRSDLRQLNSSSLEVIADVSNIDRAGVYEVSWTLAPPSTVASGDISLVTTNANKITVKVSDYKSRPEIPVVVEYTGNIGESYVRDPEVLSTEYLTVSGPAEEVNRIDRAVITVDLMDATENIEADMSYTLMDENGEALTPSEYVTLSHETVRVSVPVLYYKQLKLNVRFIPGAGATEDDVKCKIEPSTIGVTGREEDLKSIEELIIREIDLAQVTGTQTFEVTPELPAGVTNRASENSVKITVELVGLATKRFLIPCASIQRIGGAEDLDFGEQNVVITLRGPAEALNALKQESILITADMTNDYDPTTKTVVLKITLPSGTKVGVLGEPYTVQVIQALEAEPEE